jgi:ATP-dependent RNA helicase HelY
VLNYRPKMNATPPEIPPHRLLKALRGFDLLPAIIFMPTRRKCDDAASEVAADKSQKTDPERARRRQEIFEEFLAASPEIRNHKHARILLQAGVASHHAGHIPAWKLLIERMMAGGLLNAIFATSTVAAGVDFPARTVVISNADTRGNDGWRPLRASELQQMTGRAGRRGKDNVGFVVLVPGQFQDPKKIAGLLQAPPEPLESQFRATYTSLLNLLDAFGSFEHVRQIAEKSFAYQGTSKQVDQLRAQADKRREAIRKQVAESTLGISVDDVRGFERLTSSRERLIASVPATRAELRREWLSKNVVAGRVVTQSRGGKRLFLVLNISGEKVSAMRDDGEGASFALDRVNRIYKNVYSLRGHGPEQAFSETFGRLNPAVSEPRLKFQRGGEDEAVALIDSLISAIAGDAGDAALELLWSSWSDAEAIEKLERDIGVLRRELWLPFEQRARVLDHFGYLNFNAEEVTANGKWLADVRVDRTLLLGEAIRRGIFDELSPPTLAGLMASIAADSDRNYGDLHLSNELLDIIGEIEEIIYDVSNVEWGFGIEPSEEINLSAAAAAEHWAGGISWSQLAGRSGAEEGDLFRLLARTGEAIMQVAHLRDTNPQAAASSHSTADLVLRPPVR